MIAIVCAMTVNDLLEYINGNEYHQEESVNFIIDRTKVLEQNDFKMVVKTVLERLAIAA
jgi:hypothetical protein